jgi:hypothetical protein
MSPVQVHLFITHLPVFGLFFAFLALIFGLIKHNKDVTTTALAILIISVAGGVIAFQTGEPAEDAVEKIANVSHDAIEAHEESAEFTVILFYILSLIGVVGLWFHLAEKRFAKQVLYLLLLINILTFAAVIRTASLGGKVRHTEMNSNSLEKRGSDDAEHNH